MDFLDRYLFMKEIIVIIYYNINFEIIVYIWEIVVFEY